MYYDITGNEPKPKFMERGSPRCILKQLRRKWQKPLKTTMHCMPPRQIIFH
jgi:hypothetical protein